ncbi:MAG: pyruvate dehydrogenase (acetyl-transferring) E1 component subunit alpha [Armatimonadetes bacterium]|nr:pyruvate dehydrogenase (acetyl-transferring) E1 component subunit alpha [Armatimonadota bacterium]
MESALEARDDKKKKGKPEIDLSDDQIKEIYRAMVLTRALEERGTALQRQGRIGFYIGSWGQEAAQIGSAYALRKDDWIFSAYREAGTALLRGIPVRHLVAQCLGNADDPARGRQMPCHYTFRKANFASVSSPIGTQIIQAAGTGMAMKYRKKDSVCISYFGDGATSSNDFHSGLNFAGVFKAPVIFLCTNNQWAISLPVSKQTASESIAAKAVAYGMPGVRVDGNDVLAVYKVTRDAVERARNGEGPTLIEALTCRMGPHSTADDPTRYGGDREAECWREKDPIERLRHFMEVRNGWTKEDDEKVWEDARGEVARAVSEEERVALPPLNSLFEDVYEKVPPHLVEQRDELLRIHPPKPAKDEGDDYKFP